MIQYSFALLDPRNVPAAQAANDTVVTRQCGVCLHSSGQLDGLTCVYCGGTGTKPVFGIEVTVPALAARCCGNLDPQHSGGDASRAAIEEAVTMPLPWEGAVLATVRADLDSVGAMAIFAMRERGESLEPAKERIALIAASDKFARGGWPGPRPLPSTENPWPEESAGSSDSRPLAAIAAAVADFKTPIEVRVAVMRRWLLTGEEPARYREQVEKDRLEMIRALQTGAIALYQRAIAQPGRLESQIRLDGNLRPAQQVREDVQDNLGGGKTIAIIESSHSAAMIVGYTCAPVVVARNPEFRVGGGEPHVKFTIAAFEPKWCDIRGALAELAALEPGWGGSPTIGGSPQGVSSVLTTEQVVKVVAQYLK
jgi:hypothetical protein